jgi:hypothetical protein
MSLQNVEVVRRQYESFNANGMPDFGLLDPEIEWHTSDRALERGTYHGHEGVKAFLSSGNEVWTDAEAPPSRPWGCRGRRCRKRGSAASEEVFC